MSWLHACETGEDLPELKGLSIDQVKKLEKNVDRYIETFMFKLKPEDLNKSFHFTPGGGKNKRAITVNIGNMLWHMVEEELQHRGEINALLWQENIEPPIISWGDWKKASS